MVCGVVEAVAEGDGEESEEGDEGDEDEGGSPEVCFGAFLEGVLGKDEDVVGEGEDGLLGDAGG